MASTLTRWQPFADLAELRHRFDQAFSDLATGQDGGDWMPAIDVRRDDDAIRIHADVPGVKPDEIEIDVADDMLTISGSHTEEHETKDDRFVRRERRSGSFRRTIGLPAGTDPSKIAATTRDGVLEITIPLPQEQAPEHVKITPTSG